MTKMSETGHLHSLHLTDEQLLLLARGSSLAERESSHLQQCPDCHARLASEQQWLKVFSALEAPLPPADFVAKTVARFEAAKQELPARVSPFWYLLVGVVLAAVTVVATPQSFVAVSKSLAIKSLVGLAHCLVWLEALRSALGHLGPLLLVCGIAGGLAVLGSTFLIGRVVRANV